ncbi:squalene cyclase [Epidermidibacterium keratini]|uniref:Squalene cyclase n=1 Tax=Epidermidibacterium keratini TaxID=1891644 RepID=A0A7L4YM56_9ACTN|nr:squalene cyclase [Epidermidibacterium keratini]QHC00361.1 squalene cyclase [Epidermidibacterium keratini]
MVSAHVLDWLLDSDPALRWQVERDLAHEPQQIWDATRAQVATQGFGKQLLAVQDPDGQWAGGAYFPADGLDPIADEPDKGGQPFTATTWSLNALREWGVDAAALGDTAQRLAENSRWEYEDLPYWDGEVDCCINAWTVANGLWLGVDMDPLADWFAEHQLADGGWNCEWVEGSTHSSFHSTLNSLGGLLTHEVVTGGTPRTREARRRGEEYLLERHLTRRLSTGEPVGPWLSTFAYPLRWRYSALRAADYFRNVALNDGSPPDPRISEAIALVRAARQPDGTWLQGTPQPGRTWFDVDAPPGHPSKWLTLYGTRVLDWWDAATAGGMATLSR